MRLIHTACALAIVTGVLGCGGSGDRPEVVPVSGKVLYKGQPVAGARVTFMAPGSPRFATAETNANGTFHLTTFVENDGAVPGEHTVTVYKPPAEGTSTPTAKAPDPAPVVTDLESPEYAQAMQKQKQNAPRSGPGADSQLPPRYADPGQTDLKVEVPAEGRSDVELLLED